jgi:hypothetical protein
MKKIAVALATVATVAVLSAPAAEARGGRNAAAIGFGLAAGALIAAAAANSYNYYGGPAYGYGGPVYDLCLRRAGLCRAGLRAGYYRARAYNRNHRNDPNPVDMNLQSLVTADCTEMEKPGACSGLFAWVETRHYTSRGSTIR